MKYILIFSIVAAMLGGCAIVPAGYGDQRNGYYQERDYKRGGGYDRDRYYDQNDRNYRDYGYHGWQGNQVDPFRDHGG